MKMIYQGLGLYSLLLLSLATHEVYALEETSILRDQKLFDTLEINPATLSETLVSESQEAAPPSSQSIALDLPLDLDEPMANPMDQLTSVTELSDVQPDDWAYQTLQSLIERYGAIAGYPDSSFRGDQALTRYEFAAVLSTAIPVVDLSRFATQKDLEDLQRMQTEFANELKVVRKQLDRLEQTLRPVSTTTKLTGEVIFAPVIVGNTEKADRDDPTDDELTISSRVKLNFLTDLGGKNLLRTALKANNIPALQRASGSDMARLSFQGDSENRFELDELSLRSRMSKRATFLAFAAGGSLNKFTEVLNPFLNSSGEGSISRFGQRNPIYRQGGEVGVGLSLQLSKAVGLDIGYLGDKVNQPEIGLGNAAYGAIAQLTLEISKTFGLGLTYIHSFNSLDTDTGSDRANDPFNGKSDATTADSFGLETTIGLNKNLALSGWVGFSRATAKDLPNNPSANIFNWAITIAVPNLGQEGNLLGLVIGQPPKVISNDFQRRGESYEDEDTSLHFETFYRIRLSDDISMTPGLLIITNPEHSRENDSVFVGVLRTTFSF